MSTEPIQIELLTLTATVKQLQHQKGEANKRLQELDDRIAKFESNCIEQTDRLTSEQERLAKVKQEIAQSDENSSVLLFNQSACSTEGKLMAICRQRRKFSRRCGQKQVLWRRSKAWSVGSWLTATAGWRDWWTN